MRLSFVVPGRPVAWSRAGRSGFRSYTPAKVKAYQDRIRAEWADADTRHWPLLERYKVQVHAWWWHWEGDVDNHAKQVMDALQGHAWDNDRQVDALLSTKAKADSEADAGLVVTVEVIE